MNKKNPASPNNPRYDGLMELCSNIFLNWRYEAVFVLQRHQLSVVLMVMLVAILEKGIGR